VAKILNRQNDKQLKHILGEFHHDVFPLLYLKRFFFWGGPPREKQTFSSSYKKDGFKTSVGHRFLPGPQGLSGFPPGGNAVRKCGAREEIWYEFFREFLKRII